MRTAIYCLLVLVGVVFSAAWFFPQVQEKLTERETKARKRAELNEKTYGFKGVVSGRVTYPDGKPAAGIWVGARFQMHQTGAPGEGEDMTDANGRYEIRGLSPQPFSIFVQNYPTPILAPAPIPLKVTGVHTGIDFVVRHGPWVKLRLIEAETGKPISNVPILASRFDNFARMPVGKTSTKGEVEFQVGTPKVSIQIDPPGGGSDVVEAPGYPFYQELDVSKTPRATLLVKAYRGGLHKDVVFAGRVIDERGRPVEGAIVTMFRHEPQQEITDEDGRFAIKGRRITRLIDETQGGRPIAFRAEKDGLRGEIYPTPEETWKPLEIRLGGISGRGEIVGQVVDFEGKPQPNVPICYYEHMVSTGVSLQPQNGGSTDVQGRFRISHLSTGASYRLRLGGWPQGRGQRGFGVLSLPQGYEVIQLKPGETRDLGTIELPSANETVSGTLVDAKGLPVTENVLVVLKGKFTEVSASPDKEGRFTLENVVRENLTLRVIWGENQGYRTGDDSPDVAISRKVKAGEIGLRIELPARPNVLGIPKDNGKRHGHRVISHRG